MTTIPEGERIDSARVEELLDFVVKEYGSEHRDTQAATGAPRYLGGCFVGKVLIQAGYEYEFLADLDANGCSARDLDWLTEGRITPLAARALSVAQEAQDRGETWGQSSRAATQFLRRTARRYLQAVA